MSRRSKRRHRQQRQGKGGLPPGQAATPTQNSQRGTKGRALLIGAAVVVVGAILYAVSGSSGRKEEIALGTITNSAPSGT